MKEIVMAESEPNIPPGRYKFCVDLEFTDFGGTESEEIVRKRVSAFLQSEGLINKISGLEVDATRKGVINVSLFTHDKKVGALLKTVPEAYTQFGVDLKDPENPKFLPEEMWLKSPT